MWKSVLYVVVTKGTHVGVQYEVTETVVLMIMIYIREYDICDICKARKG